MMDHLLHGGEKVVFGESAYMRKTEEILERLPKRWTLPINEGPETKNSPKKTGNRTVCILKRKAVLSTYF